jgi:citrate lyase subunit beta / citryl-CoA lyase
MSIRSALFVPGNSAAMVLSSPILDADAIILDCEDAIAMASKDSASLLIKHTLLQLPRRQKQFWVRINPLGSDFFLDDLINVLPSLPDALLIPKADGDDWDEIISAIENVENQYQLHPVALIALIESAKGVLTCEKLARHPRTKGFLLGGEDFASDMGIVRREDNRELLFARYQVVTWAKAFKLLCLDTPYTDIDNLEGFRSDCEFSASIGFDGKACIHPLQADVANGVYSISEDQIRWAKEVLDETKKQSAGVFSFKGKMIDRPVILRAEQTIEKAKKWGLLR